MMLTFLTANRLGAPKREQLNGRDHLVVPVTMIVPGVLNGSGGPLFYPRAEIAKNYADWNNVPLTLYHPKRNGVPVSAREPGILESQGIGVVFHSRIGPKGQLQAQAWFDIDKTNRVAPGLIERIENGTPVELSTGLFTENEPSAGEFEGEVYDTIARNYRPDHLAILPDQRGACSIADGCGVLVNAVEFYATEPTLGSLGEHDTVSPIVVNGEPGYLVARRAAIPIPASGDIEMKKNELIDSIVANCDCWTDGDRPVLEAMDETKLTTINEGVQKSAANRAVAEAALAGFQFGDRTARFNPATKQFEILVGNAKPKNAKGMDDEENEDDAKKNKKGSKEGAEGGTNNAYVPPTTDEAWLAQAPAGVRAVVENAMQWEANQKVAIVDQLTANEGCPFSKEDLLAKPLAELQQWAKMLTANTAAQPQPQVQMVPTQFGAIPVNPQANYAGAAAPLGNEAKLSDNERGDDILPLPRTVLQKENKQA